MPVRARTSRLVGTALVCCCLVLGVTSTAALAQPVGTDAPSTTRSTLVPGEAAVTEEGSPQNDAGLVIGLISVGAIVVGATVLYLRYRGRGNTTPR